MSLTSGNHELAITLYTEAMKYAQVHETLWEGETMAIAAANRYVCICMSSSCKYNICAAYNHRIVGLRSY